MDTKKKPAKMQYSPNEQMLRDSLEDVTGDVKTVKKKTKKTPRKLTARQDSRRKEMKEKALEDLRKLDRDRKEQDAEKVPAGSWARLVANIGRKPTFIHPEELLAECVAYIKWNDENPIPDYRVFCSMGQITTTTVPKMRPLTITAMCLYIGMSMQSWKDYRKLDGFSSMCCSVEDAIIDQKLVGAIANQMDTGLVARHLGLVDKARTEFTGDGGGPVSVIFSGVPSSGRRLPD